MNLPECLYVGKSSIREFSEESWESIERDPRGLLLMWEPPDRNAKYIVGSDSAEGVTGWSRGTAKASDLKIDNGCIEVFRVDGRREPVWDTKAEEEFDLKNPGVRKDRIPEIDPNTNRQRIHCQDVQVAEFAAPCDPVELARVVKVVGTIYRGDAEQDQAELIWEAWPGCGMLMTQELLRIGYENLWRWEYISDIAEETTRLGWRSNRESMKLLWYRSRRHIMKRHVVIRSRWLLSEYADAVVDYDKMRAVADSGGHDDRMVSANLALWAAHGWEYNESHTMPVTESPIAQDFQRYAPGLGDENSSYEDWRQSALSEWE